MSEEHRKPTPAEIGEMVRESVRRAGRETGEKIRAFAEAVGATVVGEWESEPEPDHWKTRALAAEARAGVWAERLIQVEAELVAFRTECDRVGVPYDVAGLVRHHRANAALIAATDAQTRQVEMDPLVSHWRK